MSTPSEKINTPALEQLVRAKYPRDRYALFFGVPDAVGVDAKRRIDAVAIGCWGSVGRQIEGFELKVSRADWLREVKQVNKADPFIALCDRFWLVTADQYIAKPEEIPACWGWMTATKNGLRVQRPAIKLPGAGDTVNRSFMIGILRKLQDDILSSPDVQALVSEKVSHSEHRISERIRYEVASEKRKHEELEIRVRDFEEQSGIQISQWRMGNIGLVVQELRKIGYGSDGGLSHVSRVLEGQENLLRSTLTEIQSARSRLHEQARRPGVPCTAHRGDAPGEAVGGEVHRAPGACPEITSEAGGSEGTRPAE